MTKPRWVTAATLVLTSLGFGCPFFCVARGSRVRTPRGARAIEDLALGDEVVAVDPVTGETVAARLMGVRRSTRETLELSGEKFVLRCTTDHPLWDPDGKCWADAGDWALGRRTSVLLAAEGQSTAVARVTSVKLDAGVSEVFDLTVDHPFHSFVASDVVVHNKSPIRSGTGAQSCENERGEELVLIRPGEGFVQTGRLCACGDGGTADLGQWVCSFRDAGPEASCTCPQPTCRSAANQRLYQLQLPGQLNTTDPLSCTCTGWTSTDPENAVAPGRCVASDAGLVGSCGCP